MIKKILTTLILISGYILCADDAVSAFNGKLGYSVGSLDSETGKNIIGSLSLPISDRFGLQLDGLYTDVSDRDFYGLGGQWFWREHSQGLFGITAAGIYQEELASYIISLKTEYYLNRFTFALDTGISNIDYDDPVPFIDTDETGFSSSTLITVYPFKNVAITGSYSYAFDNQLYTVSLEYQLGSSGWSIFGESANGDNDYNQGLIGARFYFGKRKDLQERHRQDNPINMLKRVLSGIGTYGAEFNNRARDYVRIRNIDPSSRSSFGISRSWAIADPEARLQWSELIMEQASQNSP